MRGHSGAARGRYGRCESRRYEATKGAESGPGWWLPLLLTCIEACGWSQQARSSHRGCTRNVWRLVVVDCGADIAVSQAGEAVEERRCRARLGTGGVAHADLECCARRHMASDGRGVIMLEVAGLVI